MAEAKKEISAPNTRAPFSFFSGPEVFRREAPIEISLPYGKEIKDFKEFRKDISTLVDPYEPYKTQYYLTHELSYIPIVELYKLMYDAWNNDDLPFFRYLFEKTGGYAYRDILHGTTWPTRVGIYLLSWNFGNNMKSVGKNVISTTPEIHWYLHIKFGTPVKPHILEPVPEYEHSRLSPFQKLMLGLDPGEFVQFDDPGLFIAYVLCFYYHKLPKAHLARIFLLPIMRRDIISFIWRTQTERQIQVVFEEFKNKSRDYPNSIIGNFLRKLPPENLNILIPFFSALKNYFINLIGSFDIEDDDVVIDTEKTLENIREKTLSEVPEEFRDFTRDFLKILKIFFEDDEILGSRWNEELITFFNSMDPKEYLELLEYLPEGFTKENVKIEILRNNFDIYRFFVDRYGFEITPEVAKMLSELDTMYSHQYHQLLEDVSNAKLPLSVLLHDDARPEIWYDLILKGVASPEDIYPKEELLYMVAKSFPRIIPTKEWILQAIRHHYISPLTRWYRRYLENPDLFPKDFEDYFEGVNVKEFLKFGNSEKIYEDIQEVIETLKKYRKEKPWKVYLREKALREAGEGEEGVEEDGEDGEDEEDDDG